MPRMNRNNPQIGITLPPATLADLDARGPRSTVIARDLGRLYDLYRRHMPELSRGEAMLICDALNGAATGETPASLLTQLLVPEVQDAVALDHLDQKWEVDGSALVEKLKALGPVAILALIDAAERFWRAVGDGEEAKAESYFRVSA